MGSDEPDLTVLVAESDDDTRCLLKSMLELKGFLVLEAKDGQQAIDTTLYKRPNLLLIQLKLPVIGGFYAVRQIRKHADLRDMPIVAMSVNNPTTNHNLALAAGCNAHVQDPFEFDRLEALLDRLLPGNRVSLASTLVQ
jgi:CheY-like chemotaxis protein